MSKKSFIDSVEVKSPCSESWNEMVGTDKVRLCSHCSKHVNNLSEMTRKQATRLVRSADGNLCIRYIPDPRTKRPMFAEQLLQITRHAPSVAAGVMSASIALSTPAYSQETTPIAPTPPAIERADRAKDSRTEQTARPGSGRIKGTVLDPAGAVIAGASVSIFSVEAEKVAITTSNESGEYSFANLRPGVYRIETNSPGFAQDAKTVTVADEKDTLADAALDVGGPEISVDVRLDIEFEAGVGIGGVMIAIEYSSPLSRAVADEDDAEVRDLLARGANVNEKEDSYNKITPLFIAVETGNIEIVQILLDNGAKVNARDAKKQTPLMRLDDDATPELVDLLVRFGAKVDLADKEGNTALILAAGGADAEVVRALLDAGADVRIANKEGQTALMEAAYYDDLESVRRLINAGSDVSAKNKEGESAFDLTSNEEIENLLLSHGARPNRVKERTTDDEVVPEPTPQSVT